ncbi:MAG: response regulator [Deltaproteobacteria bacterium]|nr:response regulator [Deltaproteobacteria bacterium]
MKTVLIADDSRTFRALEQAFLVQRGFRVIQAGDGAEALRLVYSEKPDLILLDIQMPVMDGASVLATLKSNQSTKTIPVIVITTIGRDKDREIMLRGGADDFISKPINGAELLKKVKRLLE